MASCSELVGKGTVQYGCRLELGHDGPHMAPEIGPSQIERGKWEAEQKRLARHADEQAIDAVIADVDRIKVVSAVLDPALQATAAMEEERRNFEFEYRREALAQFAMDTFKLPRSKMPPAITSWLLGAECQMALQELWKAAEKGPITIDRKLLETIIPEELVRRMA